MKSVRRAALWLARDLLTPPELSLLVIVIVIVAIRDHPNRPPPLQRLVLQCLGLRMEWTTGRGFASNEQLGADADASKVTVWRATTWARGEALLVRTRKGHRIDAERKVASEWLLTQGVTGETLATQGFNGTDPTFQSGRPKVSAEHPHQESSSSESSSSLSARVRDLLAEADPKVSERETDFIIDKIKTSGGRNAHVNLIRWGWWQQAVAWLCLWAAAYLLEAALGWAAKRIGVKS